MAATQATPLTISSVFDHIVQRAGDSSDFIDFDGVLQVNITGNESANWVIDLTDLAGRVYAGQDDAADCVVALDSGDFIALASGEMTPHQAFQGGKLKFAGDTRMASALIKLFR